MYTIKETSKLLGIPASTLRYYDKIGLLPFVERRESGYRVFTEKDIEMLRLIECLKLAGMTLSDIRQFAQWLREGDATLQQRYQMFLERRRAVRQQLADLQKTLDVLDYKCWFYETAIEAGTAAVHDHFRERENPLTGK